MSGALRTPVLIVGGGLSGLATAVFLSWQGVDCLLVERHEHHSSHPRARGIHPRAMELMRAVGLEQTIRTAPSATELAGNSGVISAQSLAGPEIGALREEYVMDVSADLSGLSPTTWCLCHQDEFEPILRARAEELGADIRFGTRLVSFTQDADGVTATLEDASGATSTVRADYLVGADGPGSAVRRALKIPFDGVGAIGHFLNIHFRADLRAQLGDRKFVMCYTFNRDVKGALMPLDNARRWLLHAGFDPRAENPVDLSVERCTRLVRAAAGVSDVDVEIIGVLPWEAAGRVAETFRAGRTFLVGDAAHVMPPSGAFGSNTGLSDAYDLAWKLAFVHKGLAGPELLATYDAERRPVAAATVEQAVLRSKDRPRLRSEDPAPPNPAIVPDTAVWFGWRYFSSAVVAEAGDAVWAPNPGGLPGTRAPHVAVRVDGTESSTVDLFGRGFVLLAAEEGTGWAAAARRVGAELSVPLRGYRVGTGDDPDLHDIKTTFAESFGITATGAVLVRPDGVVAWRSIAGGGPDDAAPDEVLATALRSVLHRPSLSIR